MKRQHEAKAKQDKKKGTSQSVQKLVLGGILAALITLSTMIAGISVGKGYVHLGDGMVLASAYVLGPWGMIVAAVGSGLADIFKGYGEYVLATAVIKAGMTGIATLFFRQINKKRPWFWIVFGMVVAELFMASAYYFYEWLIFGRSWATVSMIPNLVQAAFGVLTGGVFIAVIRRMGKNIRFMDRDKF